MYTFPVQTRVLDDDLYVSVSGYDNANRLRRLLKERGLKLSHHEELVGSSNYSFHVSRSNDMTFEKLRAILAEYPEIELS